MCSKYIQTIMYRQMYVQKGMYRQICMYMYSQVWKRVKQFWDQRMGKYKIEQTGIEQYRQEPKV